jgi:multidrug efflux pump subunit AcrA (membrane-fusion protein)
MNKALSFIKARKVFFIIGLVIILFLISRSILLKKPNTELTYTIKQENLVDTVQISRTYTTASQTQVTSPTNGIITELYVGNGEEVKKGDQLFHVDSTATNDQQKTSYASYKYECLRQII